MSCMTRKGVVMDSDCCKDGSDSDFCSYFLYKSSEDRAYLVVETSFTATADGFVAEFKYVLLTEDGPLEVDFAVKITVSCPSFIISWCAWLT